MAVKCDRKRSSEAESIVEVREVRAKKDSEPEHTYRSSRRKSDADCYTHEKSKRKSQRVRLSSADRSIAIKGMSKRKPQSEERTIAKSRSDEKASVRARPGDETSVRPQAHKKRSRKDAERRSSRYRYEYTRQRESLPLRSEKRSISEAAASASKERCSANRSASLRDTPQTSLPRPSLFRSRTTSHKERPSSHASPPLSYKPERRDRARSVSGQSTTSGKHKRSSSIFGSVMSRSRTKVPEKQVECLTCMETLPASETALLSCDHRLCNACLKRVFDMSVTDPQHMPPKCCQPNKPIPIKHVEKLYDSKFKKLWNQKNLEFRTKNRIYCTAKGCGTWIKPEEMKHDDQGRKYARCSKCRTKVCCTCNGKYHTTRTCPKDPETQAFIKTAKENGWVTCYNCKATVELNEGCNHMTCRCKAQFCMICSAKWKTCDCAWFNYDAVENDRLNHMRVPAAPNVFFHPVDPRPNPNPGPINYQREMDLRREQIRLDEALARRVQILDLDENDVEDPQLHAAFPDDANFWHQRARHILAGRVNQNQQQAAAELLRQMQQNPHQHQPQRRMNPNNHHHIFFNGNPLAHPPNVAEVGINNTHAPPPAPPAPLRRANTERAPPRRQQSPVDHHAEAERNVLENLERERWGAEFRERTRASQLAGIMGGRGGEGGRVDEWRRWVDPELRA